MIDNFLHWLFMQFNPFFPKVVLPLRINWIFPICYCFVPSSTVRVLSKETILMHSDCHNLPFCTVSWLIILERSSSNLNWFRKTRVVGFLLLIRGLDIYNLMNQIRWWCVIVVQGKLRWKMCSTPNWSLRSFTFTQLNHICQFCQAS